MKKLFFKQINQFFGLAIVIAVSAIFGGILIRQAWSAFTEPTKLPSDASQELGSLADKIGDPTDAAGTDTLFGKIAGVGGGINIPDCFISVNEYNGNLGGILGANNICDSEAPGLGYQFGTTKQWRGHASAVYAGAKAWVRATDDWVGDCDGWSSSTVGFNGSVVYEDVTHIWASNIGLESCSNLHPLVCCNFTAELSIPLPPALSTKPQDFTKDSVTLLIYDNSDNEDGFYVYRDNHTPPTTKIATLPPSVGGSFTYIDLSMPYSGSFYWQVTAYNVNGESGRSATLYFDNRARKVFVSSSRYTGDVLGSGAADLDCQTLATTAGLAGVWKAWISGGPPYYSPALDWTTSNFAAGIYNCGIECFKVADNWNDLIDGTLSSIIAYDEFGQLVSVAESVWTGTNIDGTMATNTCGSWSTTILLGLSGKQASDNGWTAYGESPCSESLRLYCFQHDQ